MVRFRQLAASKNELPDIYPDNPAPIVGKGADDYREVALARWGMPSSEKNPTGRRDQAR